MKIVWFSHTAGLDGAELSLLEAVRKLADRGHASHVVLPEQGPLAELFQRDQIPVSVIPYRWWIAAGAQRRPDYRARRLVRNLLAWPGVRALLVRSRPDLVVTNTVDIPVGGITAKTLRLPHVWYVHELFGKEGHGLFFDFGAASSLSLVDRLSDRVIVTSFAMREQYRRWIPDEKIRVVYGAPQVPPGVREPLTRSDGPFRLVVVGRMSAGKRQGDAIRALSVLRSKGLSVCLTLVGKEIPEYGAWLRRLTRELGLEGAVDFLPFTNDLYALVTGSDLALICSRGEAFGRVTVEAMKLGKPVVGANSGGTAELIRDGWNGLLYEVGDVEGLARSIERLYRDRALLQRMGANAREWACETFSIDRYTSTLVSIFEEAVRAGAR